MKYAMDKKNNQGKLNINITNIKINSISTLGSLNIGKVIFTKNQATKQYDSNDHRGEHPKQSRD